MQHTGGRTESLQAGGDSSKTILSDERLLLGSFTRKYTLPMQLQEFPFASFSWG
ncbi:hypothetical protein LINPERPRIM_LOCUS30003 [Linum perenne]